MKVAAFVAVIAFAIVASSVDAQGLKRKPGLWEVQMGGSGMNMPNMSERLAQMPPEQRARVEAMMKERGMSFGANSMSTRMCLTPEEVKEESESLNSWLNKSRRESGCTSKAFKRTATEITFSGVCKEDDGDTREVQGRVFDISPEHYSMEMTSRSKEHGERTMQQKARWLSSDCGNLK